MPSKKAALRSAVSVVTLAVAILSSGQPAAQEQKPVPKDSVRVFVPGCSKGLVFTVGPRTEDQPGRSNIPEGTHFRMNGPKKLIAEIKGHEGSVIEITGLIRKTPYGPEGVRIAPGVRITPGTSPTGGGLGRDPGVTQAVIDVEAWRLVAGRCP